MNKLTAEQIQENWDKLISIVKDAFTGERKQKLLEMYPEVNGIVSSGYSRDPVLADFRKYGFTGAVTKPYNIEDLSKTLREVISGEPTISSGFQTLRL